MSEEVIKKRFIKSRESPPFTRCSKVSKGNAHVGPVYVSGRGNV